MNDPARNTDSRASSPAVPSCRLRKPRWFFALACLLLLAVGLGALALQPKDGAMPARQPLATVESNSAQPLPVSASDQSAQAAPDQPQPEANLVTLDVTADVQQPAQEYEPDIVLLNIDAAATPAQVNAFLQSVAFVQTKDVSNQDLSLGFVEVALEPGTDVARAAHTLETAAVKSSVVKGAQPNFVYPLLEDEASNPIENADSTTASTALATVQLPSASSASSAVLESQADVNDPYASWDWVEANNKSKRYWQWALEAVSAFDAWDLAKTEKAVTVAILDNGCWVDHPDLKDNIVDTYNATTSTDTAIDKDVSHLSSSYHGTHVAGITAATANNGEGVAGVSYNAGLLPVQVMRLSSGKELASTTTVSKAYRYILDVKDDYNVRVVNMSLGTKMTEADGEDKVMLDWIDKAYNEGIVSVCAAGNFGASGPVMSFPGDFDDNLVNVINLDCQRSIGTPVRPLDPAQMTRYSSSNYNYVDEETGKLTMTKDIAAPGASIYSTDTQAGYGLKSGTSMASPCVAGIVALLLAKNPDLTPAEVASVLYSTATDIQTEGFDAETGYGLVNAYESVKMADAYLTGSSTKLQVGATTTLIPSQAAGEAWEWSSSDDSIASVAAGGVVTGNGVGEVSITATYGAQQLRQTVTVFDPGISGKTALLVGDTENYSIASGQPGSWKWSSSDPEVIAIGELSGVAKALKTGEADITVALATDPSITSTVHVYSMDVDGPSSVPFGETLELTLEGAPTGVTCTWRSRDEAIVTLSALPSEEGQPPTHRVLATGVSVGTTTVSAVLEGAVATAVPHDLEVTPASIDQAKVELSRSWFVYTGEEHRPESTVTLAGKTLAPDTDYSLSYEDNVEAGTATVRVTGKGNYSGTTSATFTIMPCSLAGASVALPEKKYYCTGKAITPKPTVSLGGLALAEGADYALSYEDNVEPGTATVRVAGKGNYADEATATFEIELRSIAAAQVTFPQASYYRTGKAITPKPTVSLGGLALAEGADYALSYEDNVEPGTATVRVTGKGNYSGTTKASFPITCHSLAGARVVLPKTVYDYTGKAIRPQPTVMLNGATLAAGSDYTLSYKNNKKAGAATVQVIGKDNYAGTATATFTIVAKPTWKGATRIPVGATAAYQVKNGSVVVKSGADKSGLTQASAAAGAPTSVQTQTLTGKKAGKVVLSLRDALGRERATRTVVVYETSGPYFISSAKKPKVALGIASVPAAATQASAAASRLDKTARAIAALASDGNDVVTAKKANNATRKFFLARQSDNTYTIQSASTGKLVEVRGASKKNGASVDQRAAGASASAEAATKLVGAYGTASAQPEQRWRIQVDAKNRLTFVNAHSGKVLDIGGGKAKSGKGVQQRKLKKAAGATTQKWKLKSASKSGILPLFEGVYRIVPASALPLAAEVKGSSSANTADVRLAASTGAANQRFLFQHVGRGLYKVVNLNSGKVVDAYGAAWASGVNIIQFAFHNGNNQLWKPVRSADGTFAFFRNGSAAWSFGTVGAPAAGRSLVQLPAGADYAQKFFLSQY